MPDLYPDTLHKRHICLIHTAEWMPHMLQAGRTVVLVAVTQGAAHYQQALRKLVRRSTVVAGVCCVL